VALLEVRDLHTQFPTREGVVRAVDGSSFSVEAGESLGLVGESGSGKSVTALSIMGLVSKDAGSVTGEIVFDGRDLGRLTSAELRRVRGREIAMIFQDPMTSLNPVMRIGRQLSEVLAWHLGMSRSAARERAIELLHMVGITDGAQRIKQYPLQLSGGMRQRVMIAMALACDPRLILADEITTALDVTIQAQILELLKRLSTERDTAFVLISHDLGVVAGMTERVHVMYAGQIVEKASTVELFANPRMPYTWGLLRSIPKVGGRGTRLVPIDGSPPDLLTPRRGCPFQPRCAFRRSICAERIPDLLPIPGTAAGHEARCWGTQGVPDGGWLIGFRPPIAPVQPRTGPTTAPDRSFEVIAPMEAGDAPDAASGGETDD